MQRRFARFRRQLKHSCHHHHQVGQSGGEEQRPKGRAGQPQSLQHRAQGHRVSAWRGMFSHVQLHSRHFRVVLHSRGWAGSRAPKGLPVPLAHLDALEPPAVGSPGRAGGGGQGRCCGGASSGSMTIDAVKAGTHEQKCCGGTGSFPPAGLCIGPTSITGWHACTADRAPSSRAMRLHAPPSIKPGAQAPCRSTVATNPALTTLGSCPLPFPECRPR